jgi:hypothetical protein
MKLLATRIKPSAVSVVSVVARGWSPVTVGTICGAPAKSLCVLAAARMYRERFWGPRGPYGAVIAGIGQRLDAAALVALRNRAHARTVCKQHTSCTQLAVARAGAKGHSRGYPGRTMTCAGRTGTKDGLPRSRPRQPATGHAPCPLQRAQSWRCDGRASPGAWRS